MLNDKVLVTGAAGFIGFHVARQLLANGREVVGADSVNAYYDTKLKEARIELLKRDPKFTFVKHDLADRAASMALFKQHRFPIVIHLAAQAGVRYSLQNPYAYVDANLDGFINVLEGCRHNGCRHLVFASSSSVYGANTKLPFSVRDNVDHPISLYAASKKANELMAHAYSHLYRIPATGLRFFTVYGPWGRPDMAMFIFAKAILGGEVIKLFNHGKMRRDFTYIDDVSETVVRLIDRPPQGRPGAPADPATSSAPWKIYNVGNNRPEDLTDVVSLLEKEFGRTAIKEMLPMQPGDVEATYADIAELERDLGFRPSTTIDEGVARFATWYREYHRL
ncbi:MULTISPECIES: NAD-dependent epimerase [Bradyrhizobium]|jgi:UDP-glucuronate 4-epimerase|uniref:NAD-dependent epimerase n=1 Tax=Bradyrhizobium diazoefficiens TaxID=1355477 RepID=A0A809XB50_9BRAD|nr:NAD-dependent epimerase [Bradyrhizobium diazoefficiens]AWO93169.1 NAD-dependent epimerase [Bradyrhizobium diazoefficiens]WLA76440.1 NAD-dependent epimerase [Bradyrhizobium diazoefficiens]BCE24240.1 NAD-dependent epimerase [Bradyrhizobium diazoefficiens]BCE50497.1 NAD-dependent epimerase [Bradyrhizobium diazoefficiens]BCE94000.1 NAD-dependent epimerase [Bradyrhizobium diazoefficiens]